MDSEQDEQRLKLNLRVAKALGYSPENDESLWATEFNVAVTLFEPMKKLEGFKLELEYRFVSVKNKWEWRAGIHHPDFVKVIRGFGETGAEALCKVFLEYREWEEAVNE